MDIWLVCAFDHVNAIAFITLTIMLLWFVWGNSPYAHHAASQLCFAVANETKQKKNTQSEFGQNTHFYIQMICCVYLIVNDYELFFC